MKGKTLRDGANVNFDQKRASISNEVNSVAQRNLTTQDKTKQGTAAFALTLADPLPVP